MKTPGFFHSLDLFLRISSTNSTEGGRILSTAGTDRISRPHNPSIRRRGRSGNEGDSSSSWWVSLRERYSRLEVAGSRIRELGRSVVESGQWLCADSGSRGQVSPIFFAFFSRGIPYEVASDIDPEDARGTLEGSTVF